jgi:hypothetical protein
MSLGNGTTVSGLGTTATNSGHALDTNGNVQVDFVWGNIARQPNDLRATLTDTATATATTDPVTGGVVRLVPGKDNHDIILGGWNGYPLYTPNDLGEFTGSAYNYTPYIVVPNVVGLALTNAKDGLRDSGYQDANVKTSTAQANAAKSITVVTRTAGSYDATITAAGAVAQYPVGTKITVSGTSSVDGTWTVKSVSSTNLVTFTTTANTVLTSGTGSVVGVAGTVFSQSVLPNANSTTGSADITLVAYAVAS